MLANPAFAQWIRDGIRKDARDGDVPDAGTEAQRFAAYEQVVASRTNALVGAGGACSCRGRARSARRRGAPCNELEYGAADPDADYDVDVVPPPRARSASSTRMPPSAPGCVHGRPALLYVGNAWAPRHVVLVMPPTGEQELDVYEPSVGRVVDLPRARVRRAPPGRSPAGTCPWAAVWADLDEQSVPA